MKALCAQFSIQCPVYTTTYRTLPQSYGPQKLQASRQLSDIQPPSPISAISHNPVVMQIELVKNQKEITDLQQSLQDAYTQLEEERSKPHPPSNSEEMASLQQQLRDEKRYKEHTEQKLEEIASRLVVVREELEEEKAEKEALQLTLHSTETELDQAKNGMLQLNAEKEGFQQSLYSTMSELSRVKERAQHLHDENEDLRQNLNAATTELARAIARLSQAKAEAKVLKEDYQLDQYSNSPETNIGLEKSHKDGQQLSENLSKMVQEDVSPNTSTETSAEIEESSEKLNKTVQEDDVPQAISTSADIEESGETVQEDVSQAVSTSADIEESTEKLNKTVQEDEDVSQAISTSADIEESGEKLNKTVQEDEDVSQAISTSADIEESGEKLNKMVQEEEDVSQAKISTSADIEESGEKLNKTVQEEEDVSQAKISTSEDIEESGEKLNKTVQEEEDVSQATISTSEDIEESGEKLDKKVQVDVLQAMSTSADIEELRTQLKNSQEREKEAKAKFETIETKWQELMNSFLTQINMTSEMERHHSSQMENLQRQLEEAQKKITELESSTVSCEPQIDYLQQQLEEARKKITELETNIQNCEPQMENLQWQLEEAQKKITELESSTVNCEPQISSKYVVSSKEVELFRDKVLGTGAWGFVVEGKFRGKTVAIKCLHQEILSQFTVGQIQREISIMADLRHPNLVLFIAAILDDHSSPKIITELLSITLRRAYHENKITQANKLPILHELASALNYLHLQHKPIIHRDVSSTNVLLERIENEMWKAKLSDFGSANLVRVATTPGEGALVYAAPEMCINAHSPQAPSVDVYSYGILVCEVTTSTFPDHASFNGLLQLLQSQWPDMYRITEQCTQKSPDERPTMQNIIGQLDSLITADTL